MLKKCTNKNEYCFILDNLRDEDKEELFLLFCDSWYSATLNSLKNSDALIFLGNNGSGEIVPVSMGGFYPIKNKNYKMACVWLLSTKFVKFNKTALMRVLKQQVLKASFDYEIMYNFICKSNSQAKIWLKKLEFRFDNPKPKNLDVKEGFEFFYKVNIK